MKLLVDTNVILDVLCARKNFLESSAAIWKYCEIGRIEGYISALSVPNMVYILRKELDPERTQQIIEQLFLIFKVVDLKAIDLKKAAGMKYNDYEDALQVVCAERIKAEYIVTRNIQDFSGSSILAKTPADMLKMI